MENSRNSVSYCSGNYVSKELTEVEKLQCEIDVLKEQNERLRLDLISHLETLQVWHLLINGLIGEYQQVRAYAFQKRDFDKVNHYDGLTLGMRAAQNHLSELMK